ncbi:ribonuclease [Mesorhizobium sp.]|uniref:ribonuclease T2 family protein n=1 Tax=Mesorhizobium sp. TaxID=1871066 RepID=UPI000FE314DE|nr:ribonuclease [Mesorhizobium sp.]RWH73725.1 MAG: ribonuclease [Mesorhizobium sp.]RWL31148.1 MAG: ribonuclease [Mesorhizobium sp.]RWL36790.1 MAG: ribonuclease [Mesorhizobium sp.]RWL40450.1 MAG: ribonuclease [Mesorhizobium sp.]RWL55373.1 MAG: ribonuclease [Mesorhizobium sp.]
MRVWALWGSMVLALADAGAAHADVKMSGTFVADSACPATQAIRNGKNPGNISTEAGKGYELLAGNKDDPTHYLIQVPGADPERRWVKIGCGHVTGGGAATPAPSGQSKPSSASGKPEYVFAISWQPAFCETQASKPECKAQNPSEFDASHFTLHGLWPQPSSNFYCQVSAADKANDKPAHWGDLPPVNLDANTRAELDQVMPGTASKLDRHEWIKHGTCYGKSQQEYFSDALNLMRAVNASAVRDLFTKNIGKQLTSDEIRGAFNTAFGAGAGDRVRVSCLVDPSSGRRLIGELTLGLSGPIGPDSKLADLLMASAPTTKAGCPKGTVDPIGFQ